MQRRATARVLLAAGTALALALAGCASQQTTKTTTTPTSGTGSEFGEGTIPEGQSTGQSVALERVFFDFDRSDIRSDAAPTLRSNAGAIKGNSSWGTVTIEGHCDERGSEEYNLALGDRRASRVRAYLVDLGVPGTRLRTVSFGEAKPAVPGHSESAWRYNRRAEFTAN